ncbi:penicillin acylase family protein [Flavihumibacter rivuli]|uniref:penicillin acylase family protein n=1 Tax=Flavihumibacter rivuli TaxID=2838156 RepID=UPI001BDF2296|nr:penicillin acylase family protein [Flavihumibacter rivuli]ULQ55101.1 penicillin acylase family protein [Flavihumibacter rivuli]
MARTSSSVTLKSIFTAVLFTLGIQSFCQTLDPRTIDIVRDKWGVPHIYAPTDAGTAYGLAWAHAEDDFETIQLGFLAGKQMLGLARGKEGAKVDYVMQLLRARDLVEAKYDTDLSTAFKALLQGYADGINAYAAKHPKEVLVKKLFPLGPKDMLAYSVLQLCVSNGADEAIQRIMSGKAARPLNTLKPGGSNAYAFNSRITADGQVYLNINSHQPLEGPVSWYEAHLNSNEGWNMLGALFPGAPVVLHGCNEYLGWAHTVNNPDKLDIYQLETDPAQPGQYKVDGEWLPLETRKARLKVKIAGLPLTIKRKIYWSIYGPAIITKEGTFAFRTSALFDIRALEQWYRMNKASNFTSFMEALAMQAIPGYNIVYGDRYDTIYYLSNAVLPVRDPAFNWKTTVPGNTRKTLWTNYQPLNALPQLLNPTSGYLYNSNHSPFICSAPADNLNARLFDTTMGYEVHNNNRSIRFQQLIQPVSKLDYEQFKNIKYDQQLPQALAYPTKSEALFALEASNYPELAEIINTLQQWDRKAVAESKGAAIFSIAYYYVTEQLNAGRTEFRNMDKETALEVMRAVKAYLDKYFNGRIVSLGEYQHLVRGDKAIPLPGLPDVIASMESTNWKDGKVKGRQGESYIELVRFTSEGPIIESINCYGASNKKNSPHYADQMELFVQQKTKPMTLKREEVYQQAARIYHPE